MGPQGQIKHGQYGRNVIIDATSQEMALRKRVVSALKDMAFQVIKSVYPKKVLSSVEEQVIWPERLTQWK